MRAQLERQYLHTILTQMTRNMSLATAPTSLCHNRTSARLHLEASK